MALSPTKIDYLTQLWQLGIGCLHTVKKCPCADDCWARDRWAPRMRKRCKMCADFVPHVHWERMRDPLRRKKPARIGLGFMADLFGDWMWKAAHPVMPHDAQSCESLLLSALKVMRQCPQHRFIVLTKNPAGIPEDLEYPDNLWVGVSVTNQADADRLVFELLRKPVSHCIVSYEPACGPLDLPWLRDYQALEGVIAGGMSGPNAPPSHPDWFRRVRDQCVEAGVPFWFKQWGEWAPVPPSDGTLIDRRGIYVEQEGFINRTDLASCLYSVPDDWAQMHRVGKKAAGHMLDGREWRQLPEGLILPWEREA